jgi:hypothetical protein
MPLQRIDVIETHLTPPHWCAVQVARRGLIGAPLKCSGAELCLGGKHTERVTPQRETRSRGASVEACGLLRSACLPARWKVPLYPLRNEYAANYLVDADAMGTTVAGDGLPIAAMTSPTTSESERHECD